MCRRKKRGGELISRRGEERYRFRAPVELRWIEPQGNAGYAKGVTVDVSCHGMQVKLDVPIGLNRTVKIHIGGQDNSATANVRYCDKFGTSFKIGLHFDRTLLSENMPSIHEVLIKALRMSSERKTSMVSVGLIAGFRRMLGMVFCIVAGHDFTWAPNSITVVICARCDRGVLLIEDSTAPYEARYAP